MAYLLGTENPAQALCFLPPRPRMAADLDEDIGFWDIDGVVTHLLQEDRVHLHHCTGLPSQA